MIDRLGQKLGNYQLIRLLGQGGFAQVYLGEHVHLKKKRLAAIKILTFSLERRDQEQFRNEATIIASLDHSHIIQLLDYDVDQQGVPFLVMTYAPLGPLPSREQLPLPVILPYVQQVAEALDYVHSQGLIHRDVKPANVLLKKKETVLLSDFGIATLAREISSRTGQGATGTPVYMAPEQRMGHPCRQSDQYSLAVMVHFWLTGAFPGQPQTLPALPPGIAFALSKALSPDPHQRFELVQDFVTALQQAARPSSLRVQPGVPPPPVSSSPPMGLGDAPSPTLERGSTTPPALTWRQKYLTRRTMLRGGASLIIGGSVLAYFIERYGPKQPDPNALTLTLPPAPPPNIVAPPSSTSSPPPVPPFTLNVPAFPRSKNRTPQELPNHLYLGDVDGDGIDEFFQVADNRLLVFRANAQATGVLHLYFPVPISRLIIGAFAGQTHHDQVCVVLANGILEAYGISNDLQILWWWFTQNNMVSQNETVIVGDFNGDGNDDLLLHNPYTGSVQIYGKTKTFFTLLSNFQPGDLSQTHLVGTQLLAGAFRRTVGRDDLLVIDRQRGQISRFDSITDAAGAVTFRLVFTTTSGVITNDDQVVVANLDGGTTEGIIIHNRSTDTLRLYQAEVSNGNLIGATGVTIGQPSGKLGQGILTSSRLKEAPLGYAQPGGATPHDLLFFSTETNQMTRIENVYDASTSQFLYKWVYNKPLSTYHQGWPTSRKSTWAILLAHLADNTQKPKPLDFFKQLFTTNNRGGGAAYLPEYFRDISYGTLDISSTEVLPPSDQNEWYPLPYLKTTISQGNMVDPADHQEKDARQGLFDKVVHASGIDPSRYDHIMVVFNTAGTGYGGNPDWVVIDPGDPSTRKGFQTSAIAQQMLQGYGLPHAYDDKGNDYGDPWDIMGVDRTSLGLAYMFVGFNQAYSGPELNAAYKARMGFLPANRVLTVTPNSSKRQTYTVSLAAINRPEANGYLTIKIPIATGKADHAFFIEFRQKSFWDIAIPQDAVLIHEYQSGESFLQTKRGGAQFLPGMTFTHQSFTMTVKEIHGPDHQKDPFASTALIEITS